VGFELYRPSSFARVSKLAAGERFETPIPGCEVQGPERDDAASRLQRDCFHAPYAQHRRLIDVVAESGAINTCAIYQLAVICATVAVEFGSKLYLKAFEFNYLYAHNLVGAGRIELPSQPGKGRILAVRRRFLSAHP
jgi:hypothetical protein